MHLKMTSWVMMLVVSMATRRRRISSNHVKDREWILKEVTMNWKVILVRISLVNRLSVCLSVCIYTNFSTPTDDETSSRYSDGRLLLPRQPESTDQSAPLRKPLLPAFSEKQLEVYQKPFQPSATPEHLHHRFMVSPAASSSVYGESI